MAARSVRVTSVSTGAVPPAVRPRKSRAKPKARSALTPIRVHYNVGLGNRITVRGDTEPLRWDGGLEAQNAAADLWQFQLERVPAGQTFQFKPLINDTAYSTGDNYVGTGGQTLDIYPAF
jgi:hypothetical protein